MASTILQACVDGYFVSLYTLQNFLADEIKTSKIDINHPEFNKVEEAVK
ncbi:hypothetical protein [Winogradskyella costae]|nr:hypothetical protein [Winogradskyella costae]